MKNSLRKDAARFDGHGRSLMNKMPRAVKRKLDRQVDKRRRRASKRAIGEFSSDSYEERVEPT